VDPAAELETVRSRLNADLRKADDESFLRLIFAIDSLQNGRANLAAPILRGKYPEAAVGAALPSRSRIHEWELETLANEALAQPYRRFGFGFPTVRLDCNNYDTMVHLTNLLRETENLEYAASGVNVLKEMYRIAARQFEWQRGFFNKTSLYRSAFLFDGPACQQRLTAKTGFSFNELSLAGFCLYTIFNHYAQLDRNLPMDHVGISDSLRNATLELITCSIDEARTAARTQRAGWKWIAYRPSVLRQKPCIGLRYSGKLVIAPLPALILERLSSGIFYDVAADEGGVRNEIGSRFEEYCARLLSLTQRTLRYSREFAYRTKRGDVRTPDILLGESSARWALIECKATRMSFPARYSDTFESERGYGEIAKAVFQIWRYVAHCRLGIAPDTVVPDCTGVVLTLDSWMLMGSGSIYERVYEEARKLAASKEPRVLPADQIPVIFCQIPEWEELLTSSTEQGFRRVLQGAATDEFRGWPLSSIPKRDDDKKKYRYPFRDLHKVVPWWGQLASRGTRRRRPNSSDSVE
jgi:hypothetical protein